METKCLTIKEAAKYLSAKVWFVRNLLWKRELLYIKVGKHFVIATEDLDAWIERNKVRA